MTQTVTQEAERPRCGPGGCRDRFSQVDREIRLLRQKLYRLPRHSHEAREVEERLDRLIVEYLRLNDLCGEPDAGS